jgi:MFS family permease
MPVQPRTVSATIATIQGLLVLIWTQYVMFLPQMAQAAGIGRGWVVWLLVADQITFVLGDWAAGVYADRLARTMRLMGALVVGTSIVSGLLLVALPDIAELRSPTLFILAMLAWAASSSALRAPVFSLLGRVGGVSRKSGVINGALIGVSVAGAAGPLLTGALSHIDPRVPLLAASIALVLATLPVLRIDAPGRSAPTPVSGSALAAVMGLSVTTWLVALGMQLFTAIGPQQFHPLSPMAKLLWSPLYWSGFAVGLLAGAPTGRARSSLPWTLATIALGAAAMAATKVATGIGLLAASLTLAGACWAVVYVNGLRTVLQLSRDCAIGTPIGIYLSVIALAAAARLLLAALGVVPQLDAALVAAGLWVLAGLGLVWTPRASATQGSAQGHPSASGDGRTSP